MPSLFRQVTTCQLLTGSEVAQFGWWIFCIPDDVDILTIQGAINSVGDHWWDGVREHFHTSTQYASAVLQQFSTDAPYPKEHEVPLLGPENPLGAINGNPLPPQCAVVVSVKGGTVGPSGSGRFYLPPIAADQMNTSARIPSATASDFAEVIGTYFVAVQDAIFSFIDIEGLVGTFSRKTGGFTPAASVNVGNVIDTQRRRRDALPEIRASFVM